MKFFRVGSCLALLMAGVACTQAPQAITAPSAAVGGSTAATAARRRIHAEVQCAARSSRRLTASARKIAARRSFGRTPPAKYAAESASPTTSRSARRPRSSTRTPSANRPISARTCVDFDLEYDTVYSWRVRAHVGNRVRTVVELGELPVADAPGRGGAAARQRRRRQRRLRRAALAAGSRRDPQAAGRTIRLSCARVASAVPGSVRALLPGHTAARWEFMDRTIDALRAERRPLRLQRQARQHERPVAGRRELLLRQPATTFKAATRSTSSTSSAATAARRRRRSGST